MDEVRGRKQRSSGGGGGIARGGFCRFIFLAYLRKEVNLDSLCFSIEREVQVSFFPSGGAGQDKGGGGERGETKRGARKEREWDREERD
jgi:hypothetical protein